MKRRIRFNSPKELADFINICNTYISDINVLDGHIAIDAKSIVSVFSLSSGKTVEVEMISCDDNEIKRFENDIKKFEV